VPINANNNNLVSASSITLPLCNLIFKMEYNYKTIKVTPIKYFSTVTNTSISISKLNNTFEVLNTK